MFTNVDFLGIFWAVLLLTTDNIVYRSQNSKIKGIHLEKYKAKKNFGLGLLIAWQLVIFT